jgi:hypothetical protein
MLAVYNKNYNGGYEFTAYQWYRDDSPVPGATESIYHTEGQIPVGAYYVELTDKNGMVLRSCAQNIIARPFPQTDNGDAPAAQKYIQNNCIIIQLNDVLYNIYGQKVQ